MTPEEEKAAGCAWILLVSMVIFVCGFAVGLQVGALP